MKKVLFFLVPVLMCLVGCQQEQFVDNSKPIEFATFSINVGQTSEASQGDVDTKSIINLDSENFHTAALFAFYQDGSETKCLTAHPDKPVFNWDLPLRTQMSIYCLYNYDNESVVQSLLNGASNAIKTKTDLEAMVFSCPASTFSSLNASGLPKAGIRYVEANELTTGNEVLKIVVKNLFAKFNIKVMPASDLTGTLSIQTLQVYNMNENVSYFGSGSKSTSTNSSIVYDRASSSDLSALNGSNTCTLYVLENMQGEITTGFTEWQKVAESSSLADALRYCTFIDMSVLNDRGENKGKKMYHVTAYLNTNKAENCLAVKDFNIERNKQRDIVIYVSDEPTKGVTFDESTIDWRRSRGRNVHYELKGGLDPNTVKIDCNVPGVVYTVDKTNQLLKITGSQYDMENPGYAVFTITAENVYSDQLVAKVFDPYRLVIDAPDECVSGDNVIFTAKLYDQDVELSDFGACTWSVSNFSQYNIADFPSSGMTNTKATLHAIKSNLWYANYITGNPNAHITTVPTQYKYLEISVSCALNDGSGEVLTATHKISINPMSADRHVYITSNPRDVSGLGDTEAMLAYNWAEIDKTLPVDIRVFGKGDSTKKDFTISAGQLKSDAIQGLSSYLVNEHGISSIQFKGAITLTNPNNNLIEFYNVSNDTYYKINTIPLY